MVRVPPSPLTPAPFGPGTPGAREVRRFLRLAAAALLVGVLAGLTGSTYYTPAWETTAKSGLTFQSLRPLHTLGTIAWVYAAGCAVVYRWLFQRIADRAQAGDPRAARLGSRVAARAGWHLALWIVAGALAAGSLLAGKSSGREYLEYPPVLSVPILAGWALFAWSFVDVTRLRVRGEPVYAWMWATSLVLFAWTFAENHLWLLDWFMRRPLRDIAIQWKATGAMVGSFNLLVYGALSWLATRRSGSEAYARSNLAFSLFLVGVLNSFTNYGHHTYHLPQSEWVKWVAFVVSMTEVVILARVVWDVSHLPGAWRRGSRDPVAMLLAATSVWTLVQLVLATAISIPPVNTLFHGTLLIVAHSMGAVIGIDTMALLAVGAVVWTEVAPPAASAVPSRAVPAAVLGLNAGLLVLSAALLWTGAQAGMDRSQLGALPSVGSMPAWLGVVFAVSGVAMSASLVVLAGRWLLRRRPAAAPVVAAS